MEGLIITAMVVIILCAIPLERFAINIGIRIRDKKERKLIRKERVRFDG